MTCFDCKVEVEISTVLYHKFSVFYFIYKDAAEVYFTFLITLDGIRAAAQENRMRKNISDSFDVYKDRSISPHYIAIDVIVESL
jgi:hypothetical protein